MTKSPGKSRFRNGHGLRLVFAWSLLFTLAISSTVLLANDHKNLHSLLKFLGLQSWIAKTVPKTVHVKPVQKTVGTKIRLPEWTIRNLDIGEPGQFDRIVSFETKNLCSDINGFLGKQELSWNPSPLDPQAQECWTEMPSTKSDDGSIHNSLFILVRGTSDKKVSDIRIKLVTVPNEQTPDYRQMFGDISTVIFDGVGWSDLNDRRDDIDNLRPFQDRRFGIEISLSKEVMMDGAYNLIIRPLAGDAQLTRQRKYFDRSSWFPLIDENQSQNDYPAIPATQPKKPESTGTNNSKGTNTWDQKTRRLL